MSTTPDVVNEISKHRSFESGHAKNASNFEQLISYCVGYGTNYNPSKASIKVASMNTLLTSARTAITNEEDKHNTYKIAIDAREILFAPAVLSKLVTKIMNSLKSSDVTEQKVADALTYTRKLQGRRAKPKIKIIDPEPGEPVPGAEILIEQETKNISASQMSYDNRLDNLDKLIKLLSSVTTYAPNEAELKVTALTTMLNDFKTKNSAVLTALVSVSNSRISRNDTLYKENTGVVDVAADVKAYVKSIFGATSPQYRQISGIRFVRH